VLKIRGGDSCKDVWNRLKKAANDIKVRVDAALLTLISHFGIEDVGAFQGDIPNRPGPKDDQKNSELSMVNKKNQERKHLINFSISLPMKREKWIIE
jgi:hypothetical protein